MTEEIVSARRLVARRLFTLLNDPAREDQHTSAAGLLPIVSAREDKPALEQLIIDPRRAAWIRRYASRAFVERDLVPSPTAAEVVAANTGEVFDVPDAFGFCRAYPTEQRELANTLPFDEVRGAMIHHRSFRRRLPSEARDREDVLHDARSKFWLQGLKPLCGDAHRR